MNIQYFPIAPFVKALEVIGSIYTKVFLPDENIYRPKLLDLQHVELPEGFKELREAIAENAHDMWALERQSEGWTYGLQFYDSRLEPPTWYLMPTCSNPKKSTTISWLIVDFTNFPLAQ